MNENFYKRLRELSAIDKTKTSSTPINAMTLIDYKRADDGTALGIIKENHNYYIKTSKVQGDKLTVADFAYIGGIENKRKYQYESLAKAEKQREFYMASLNEAFSLNDKEVATEKKVSLDEATKLNIDEPIEKFLKKRISEGKKRLLESTKEKFKKNLKTLEKSKAKNNLVSEIADSDIDTNRSDKENITNTATDTNTKTKTDVDSKIKSYNSSNETKEIDGGSDNTIDAELDAAAKALDDLEIADASADNEVSGDNEIKSSISDSPKNEPTTSPTTAGIDDKKSDADLGDSSPETTDIDDKKPDADLGDSSPATTDTDDKKSDADLGGEKESNEDHIKKVEKLTGKLDNAVRNTELTNNKTTALLNQIISSFKDKLKKLDTEERKEIANKILKVEKDDDLSDEEIPELDVEANEAIDAHIANLKESGFDDEDLDDEMYDLDDELGITPDEKKKAKAAFDADSGFNNYLRNRGYDDISECSEKEMASVISGWATDHADGENDGDYKTVAIYLTPAIQKELEDAGHGDFIKKLKDVVGEIDEKHLVKFGSFEPMPDYDDEMNDTKEESEMNIAPVGDILTANSDQEKLEKETEDKVEESKQLKGNQKKLDKNKNNKLDSEDFKILRKEKVDESTDKLKKFIKIKIEEKLGLRKPVLAEGKKTPTSLLIERIIEEELDKLSDDELNEISLRGLWSAGKKIGSMVSGAAQKAYGAVEQKIQSAADTIKAAGDEIVKTYYADAKNDVIDDIEKMAVELGKLIAKLNAKAVKAGEQPINPRSILATIQNQIAAAKSDQPVQGQAKPAQPQVNLGKFKTK